LSIQDCVNASPSPKVDEYQPREEDKFAPYLFIVIHTVEYHREKDAFTTTELNLFLGKNFLVTYHDGPMRSVSLTEANALKGSLGAARAPDRLAHVLLDSIVDSYNPAFDEVSLQIVE